MTKDALLRWYEEVDASFPSGVVYVGGFTPEGHEWIHNAALVVSASLPSSHRLVALLSQPLPEPGPNTQRIFESYLSQTLGAFRAAKKLFAEGRVEDFAGTVRAETEGEVLDAASELLSDGYVAAATVLIGGALEVHLKRLYSRQPGAQPIKGAPSIEKYDNAINTARNDGHPTPYDAAKSKDVKAWGAKRNDAAHDPVGFKVPEAEIKLMLEGVRLFITTVR